MNPNQAEYQYEQDLLKKSPSLELVFDHKEFFIIKID